MRVSTDSPRKFWEIPFSELLGVCLSVCVYACFDIFNRILKKYEKLVFLELQNNCAVEKDVAGGITKRLKLRSSPSQPENKHVMAVRHQSGSADQLSV